MSILFLSILAAVDLSGWRDSFTQGLWAESMAEAEEAVASDTSSADAWAALAFSAGALGHSEAPGYAEIAVSIDSLSAMAWGALASTCGLGTDGSLERFDRALALEPDLVLGLVGRAHCLMLDERYQEALDDLERAEETDPEWISIWLKRSEVYRYSQDLAMAEETVARALSIWPRNRQLLMEAAWIAELRGRYEAAEGIYMKVCDEYEDDTESLIDLGMLLEHQGRFGEAVKVYRELSRRDPDDYWCLGEIGICLETLGDTAGARRSYLDGLSVNPDYAFAHYRMGILAEAQEDPGSAMEWYSQCVQADPGFVEAWTAMGLLYEDAMDYVSAERMYRNALEEDPYYTWAWGELGLVLEQQGRYDDAGEAYENGIFRDSSYVWAWEQRGLLLEDQGRLEDAARWYGKAVETLDQPGVWLLGELGFVLERLGMRDSASVHYSRAVSIDSSYTFGLQRLAPILSAGGDHVTALRLWDRYVDSGGMESTAIAERTMIYEELGMEAEADSLRAVLDSDYPYAWVDLAWTYSLAEPGKAMELAERAEAAAMSRDDQELWMLIAGLFEELDEEGGADRSYGRAASLAPDSAGVWLEWGYFLFDHDREEEAAEKYERVLELDSLSFGAWSGLGEALLFSGSHDRALQALERSLEINPGSPWVYAYMGLAWEQKGNSEKAMDYYFQALSRSPGYDYAESRIRGITDASYDPDWNRRRSRRFSATLYVDTRVDNGNVRERDYSGGLEITYQYDSRGSEASLEADYRFIETSKDYASDYSWTMITASVDRSLSDEFTVSASSSWDRQPGTVRPWQISSYLSFGYKNWVLDWFWLSPSFGIGQVNTHWASGLANERTDRTTLYGSLSLWFEKEDSPFPSLWLWGNFYLPPEDTENTITNGLAELTLEMWDPLSLTFGYSVGYTRTPVYDYWNKYDTEFYSRLNLRLF
mgnify:FL=1